MGLLGISLLVASVVYVIIRPPSWLRRLALVAPSRALQDGPTRRHNGDKAQPNGDAAPPRRDDTNARAPGLSISVTNNDAPLDMDRQMMPPPPLPSAPSPPRIQEPDSPTTPKAKATQPATSLPPPPSFSLSTEPPTAAPPSASAMMPPPPRPAPRQQPPTLGQFPAANSAQRARGPAPNRLPPPGSSRTPGLAPPPTHSSKPAKPSRQVTLEPGHSPLDWARMSGGNADLRGVPPSTPYLRVTPSMLKRQTGRKGKDAWMALNGKVYNVTPYAPFHPGGVPEMMRGAGRDGTKLFGEIHPWVNYETMLSACLVGLLVEEPVAGALSESEMDQMD